MKANRSIMATAAAALFVAGSVASAQESSEAEKVKCDGVNSCKAESACKTDASACKGQNACKGKGFLMLSAEDCEAAKAKLEAEEEAATPES